MKVNLEEEWYKYLNSIGLKEENLSSGYIQETKRAFYGAWGRSMLALKYKLSIVHEDKALEIAQDIVKQIERFWLTEMANARNQ